MLLKLSVLLITSVLTISDANARHTLLVVKNLVTASESLRKVQLAIHDTISDIFVTAFCLHRPELILIS